MRRSRLFGSLLATTSLVGVAVAATTGIGQADPKPPPPPTATPIQHVVVIFQENVSFDHYFATYAQTGDPNRPGVNGLTAGLLTHNPNSAAPQLLHRNEALTCDQGHNYTKEQQAVDAGLMDKFVENTNNESCAAPRTTKPGLVMDYYDGSTVTALWNYAHRYAMSDNSFSTTFGPSTPGALNLISGQTHGVGADNGLTGGEVAGSVIGDPQPLGDKCSTRDQVQMTGRNVGDLLNAKGVTWGWFQGGFGDCTAAHEQGAATQGQQTGQTTKDYIPHHQPFQYYASTANPQHLPPSSAAAIGRTDQANHQYDINDFWKAADQGHMPAVSFLKAPAYQDGHAGYSDPLDEQVFLVNTLNHLQQLDEWRNTAVVIAYDDSDGWYDHQMPPILNQSQSAADTLNAPGSCGSAAKALQGYQGRCGYGPRQPLLVISPWARQNFVDHTTTDQSSILRFIEDNWGLGRIGDGSFDAIAGPLTSMFDFGGGHDQGSGHGQGGGQGGGGEGGGQLILDPKTGRPVSG
ncbi:MAG: phospholipase [Acidimicrobiales bacterium]|nr:phospholipase [Acidimicrobiales bacterium]